MLADELRFKALEYSTCIRLPTYVYDRIKGLNPDQALEDLTVRQVLHLLASVKIEADLMLASGLIIAKATKDQVVAAFVGF